MGTQHHPGAAAQLAHDQVAHGVGGYLVGQGAGQLGQLLPDAPLVPGGAVGCVQRLDQFQQFHS